MKQKRFTKESPCCRGEVEGARGRWDKRISAYKNAWACIFFAKQTTVIKHRFNSSFSRPMMRLYSLFWLTKNDSEILSLKEFFPYEWTCLCGRVGFVLGEWARSRRWWSQRCYADTHSSSVPGILFFQRGCNVWVMKYIDEMYVGVCIPYSCISSIDNLNHHRFINKFTQIFSNCNL